MRSGDTVERDDSRLTVMGVRGNEFVACGWPFCFEKVKEWSVDKRCTDSEHILKLRDARGSSKERSEYVEQEILESNIVDAWLQAEQKLIRGE